MAVMEILCPRCGFAPGGEADPHDGAVMNCQRCGFMGIWEEHYWRTPTDAERRALLHDRTILIAQFAPIWAGLYEVADAERMRNAVRRELLDWSYRFSVPRFDLQVMVDHVVQALQAQGFHTHHEPIEVPEDDR